MGQGWHESSKSMVPVLLISFFHIHFFNKEPLNDFRMALHPRGLMATTATEWWLGMANSGHCLSAFGFLILKWSAKSYLASFCEHHGARFLSFLRSFQKHVNSTWSEPKWNVTVKVNRPQRNLRLAAYHWHLKIISSLVLRDELGVASFVSYFHM